MGRTPKSLAMTIGVPREWLGRPEIVALAEKGHTVVEAGPPLDLLLAPWAHAWQEPMFDKPALLAAAMSRVRRAKKEAKRAVA